MNKRITSLALVFAMLVSLLATAVPAAAAAGTNELVIVPDRTEAHPGDTINYTVYLGPISDLASMDIEVIAPSGLTFITGQLVEGLKTTLHCADVSFDITTINKLSCYGCGGYESTTETALFTFSCSVDDTADGEYSILVNEDTLDFGDTAWGGIPVTYTKSSSKVTVTPASTAVPVTGISVMPTSTTLTESGQTFTVVPTVAPAEATNKNVTFTSSNTAVATVNETTGVVTAVANGTTNIVATAEGDTSKTATCVVTVSIPTPPTISETPLISIEPGDGNYDLGATAAALSVTASVTDGGTLVYQWYKNTVGSTAGGTKCGTNSSKYTPDISVAGTTYYYCVITNENPRTTAYATVTTAVVSVTVNAPMHEHNATLVAAKAATCTTDGNTAYYTCTCGEWFEDVTCNVRIVDRSSVVIPAAHTWEEVPAVASTCTVQGNNHYWHCKACNKYFKDDKTTETTVAAEKLPLAAHSWSTTYLQENADANKHYHVCNVCGIKDTGAAHEWNYEAATEEHDKHCTVCGYVAEAKLPALTPITRVDVSGITLPVVGQTADFTGTVPEGAPYHFATPQELTDDDYYAAEFVNGIAWSDLSRSITSTDTFMPGETYYCCFALIANEGYKFADEDSIINTINGTETLVDSEYSCSSGNCFKFYTIDFYCEIPDSYTTITEVAVTDVVLPITGEHPDYDVTIPVDANYRFATREEIAKHINESVAACSQNGVIWFDSEGSTYLTPDSVFEDGKAYLFGVILVPLDNCLFGETVTGMFNGNSELYSEEESMRKKNIFAVSSEEFTASVHTHVGTLVAAKAPTFTEEGNNAYYTCSCGRWYEDAGCTVEIKDHSSVIIPMLEYAFTEGSDGTYTKGSGKGLQFKVNGSKDDCTGVKVDGVLIDASNYTLESGSTIVTLKSAYVDTLAVGEHTVTVVYGAKEVSTTFVIEAASQGGQGSAQSAHTGDTGVALLAALLLVSCGGATVICVTKKERAGKNKA